MPAKMRDLNKIPTTWRVPKNVTIELTSRCNLRCKYCPSTLPGAPKSDMNFDFFKSIIDRIDFPTIVVPYSNGESLLHPNITEAMDYVINEKKLTTYLTTNGTIWNEDLFRMTLEDNSYYQTIFSLDGLPDPSSKAIELCRPGSNRKVILSNIMRYLELKKEMGSKTDVAVKITQRGQDWEEVEKFISYWLSVPEIDFVARGNTLIGDTEDGMRRYPCQYSDNVFMMIRWDGRLTLCMYNDRIVNGGENPVGNLDWTTDLLEVYNNEAYTDWRQDQHDGLFHGPCRTCAFAFTGAGYSGEIAFRDQSLYPHTIYTGGDYFNTFYSKTRKIRKGSFYGYQWPPNYHDHLKTHYATSEVSYDGGPFGR